MNLSELLKWLSTLSAPFIAAVGLVHLAVFIFLWAWSRRDLRVICASLDDFTRGQPHRSVLDRNSNLSDQIEAFIADVREILSTPGHTAERALLLTRINILDEKRKYLHSLFFETAYNVCRTMIEAYPLMGILGTVLGIGSALQSGSSSNSAAAVGEIVARFGDSIWGTFAGLAAAIVLLFINSLLEPKFLRLIEHRIHVRDLVAKAKRELSLSMGGAV